MMPYLELPLVGGYTGRFQPVSISAYWDAGDNQSMVFIDGQPFNIDLDLPTLEKYLTDYWTKINTKQTVKQRLVIVQ